MEPEGTYAGFAFPPRVDDQAAIGSDRETERKLPGSIRISGEGVEFVAGSRQVMLPWSGLAVKPGGARERLIFFTHPSRAGWTVYTSDTSILDHPALIDRMETGGLARSLRLRRRRRRAFAFLVLLGVVLAGTALWRLKGVVVDVVVDRIPVDWEDKLGSALFDQVRSRSVLLEDPVLHSELEEITGPLTEGVGETPYTFRFHIAKNPAVNAFALPGGYVVVHTGLLLAAETPEEVAGVLAHEIAHVTRRHGLRQMVNSAGVLVLLQAFLGDVRGLWEVMLEGGAMLALRKFSRDAEREADEQGFRYLVSAGIDPKGMLTFFETLRAEERAGGAGVPELLSTHPATEERIERLRELIAGRMGRRAFGRIALGFSEFQDRLRRIQEEDVNIESRP